jgi:hypothetical protein
MPATARHLLQGSSTAGSYGPTNSFQQVGGYGSYGSYGSANGRSNVLGSRILLAVGGYGYGKNTFQSYGYGRSLAENEAPLETSDPFLQYTPYQPQQQQQQQQRQQQETGNPLDPAAPGQGDSSSEGSRSRAVLLQQQQQQQLSIPAGKCYCRYDPSYSTWALAEDTCKEALYTRCQVRPLAGMQCYIANV